MRRVILAVLVCWFVTTDMSAQEVVQDPYQGIGWQPDFEKALQLAKKEKKPLMVAFILRGESANEAICGDHFQCKEIIELSREFVCLLAYAQYVIGDNKGDTKTSDAYINSFKHRITRKQLKDLELEARGEYMEAGQVSAPQFLFVKPDGQTLLLRHIWSLSKSELAAKMHKALHYHDSGHKLPGVVAEEEASKVGTIKELLVEADDNNMNSRREAMSRVAVMDHPMVIDFLIKQTSRDVDQPRRLEAVRAMGQEGQVKYLPRLHRMLQKERGFQVRSHVAEALGNIGLVESVTPLLRVLKKEKKKRLRSIVIQSLMTCSAGHPDVVKELSKVLRTGGDLDRITIMYQLTGAEWRTDYDKALQKCLKASSAQVRAAAYFVAGTHKLRRYAKRIKARLSTEKHVARNACLWCLQELTESVSGDPRDPSSDISAWLASATF